MSEAYRVELSTVGSGPTATGSAGPLRLTVDRPVAVGGGGKGFNGGQLLYLAVAACYSNDLYREASAAGIVLTRVAVSVDGDFPGRGAVSSAIAVDVELDGEAGAGELERLLDEVERVAEIPATLRAGVEVTVRSRKVRPATGRAQSE